MATDGRLEDFKQWMATKGVDGYTAMPPLWRLLWSCGLRLPPPPFMGFLPLFLITGGFFGPVFATCAWLIGNRGAREMPLSEAGMLALVAGVAFGLAMAAYYRHLRRKHGLGTWDNFAPARTGR